MSGYVYAEFLEAVRRHRMAQGRDGLPCWVCSKMGRGFDLGLLRAGRLCEERSGGVVDAHHLIPKQVLKREWRAIREHVVSRGLVRELDVLLMDPRNGVLVRRYHHDALEQRGIVVPKALWPADALEFAEELGLGWWVEKMTNETRRA